MTTPKRADKFPLWWHTGAGAWCKKYKGRFWYLGRDKDEALTRWAEVKKAVDAGKEPNPVSRSRPTVWTGIGPRHSEHASAGVEPRSARC